MSPPNRGPATLVKIVDPSNENRDAKLNSMVQALEFISTEHGQIHQGRSFERHIDSGNALVASLNVAFKTVTLLASNNRRAHMIFGFSSNDEILFEILEGVTWTQGSGTALDLFNHRRDSLNESVVLLEDKNQATFTASNQVIKNVTGISGDSSGEAIFENQYTYNAGLGISVAAESRQAAHEWILAPDTTYVVRMTQTDGNCKMSIDLHWYELADE
jgi:hypothetical protein